MPALRLCFTPGSPFARAIRIMLDEIGLEWEPDVAGIKDSAEDRARRSPALQVPTLVDGFLTLWDSSLIADYLLATYPDRPAHERPALAQMIARPGQEWTDRRLFATVQTLGASTVTVSQMRWSGTTARDNAFIARNVERIGRLIDWFETQLPSESEGFVPGVMSVQDIFCVCHLMFITHRPLEIEWHRGRTPRLAALHDRLSQRESFQNNPITWWAPGMTEPTFP